MSPHEDHWFNATLPYLFESNLHDRHPAELERRLDAIFSQLQTNNKDTNARNGDHCKTPNYEGLYFFIPRLPQSADPTSNHSRQSSERDYAVTWEVEQTNRAARRGKQKSSPGVELLVRGREREDGEWENCHFFSTALSLGSLLIKGWLIKLIG